jgi:light-regulated signal transduction histidine kinase (bacteriophytochrome)
MTIQPRGYLLAVDEATGLVVMASDNATTLLAAERVVGRSLETLLGVDVSLFVDALAGDRHSAAVDFARPSNAGPALEVATVHRSSGLLVLEIEPWRAAVGPLFDARESVLRFQAAADLPDLLQAGVEEIAVLTSFDRVHVCRLDEDGGARVVAEQIGPGISSMLGVTFPPEELPAEARQAYAEVWVRLIDDVTQEPVGVNPPADPRTDVPLDLSNARMRAVSGRQAARLRELEIGAVMLVSLVVERRLWGLVACWHHQGPMCPPSAVRADAEFLGRSLSLQIATLAHHRPGAGVTSS